MDRRAISLLAMLLLAAPCLAEDQLDIQASRMAYGAAPVERLQRFGLLDSHALLIHGVHLGRNDLETIAELDATLVIDDTPADVQTVRLAPGRAPRPAEGTEGAAMDGEAGAVRSRPRADDEPLPGSVASVAFDELSYGGGGVVEVELRVDDALKEDNRAWAVIQPIAASTTISPRVQKRSRGRPRHV